VRCHRPKSEPRAHRQAHTQAALSSPGQDALVLDLERKVRVAERLLDRYALERVPVEELGEEVVEAGVDDAGRRHDFLRRPKCFRRDVEHRGTPTSSGFMPSTYFLDCCGVSALGKSSRMPLPPGRPPKPLRDLPKHGLHHGQVLEVVVRLKEGVAGEDSTRMQPIGQTSQG
jgi:hypothetical protein